MVVDQVTKQQKSQLLADQDQVSLAGSRLNSSFVRHRQVNCYFFVRSGLTLVLIEGGGFDSIQLFKEIFSQPKLDIFRGV